MLLINASAYRPIGRFRRSKHRKLMAHLKLIIVKKLYSLKHILRTTVPTSHNKNSKCQEMLLLSSTSPCSQCADKYTVIARKQLDDRYDLNQLRTEPWIPNQDDRRVIKMSWSVVSKAAERSCRQRYFLWSCCTDEVIVDIHKKPSYRRGTARRAVTVKTVLNAAQMLVELHLISPVLREWPLRSSKVIGNATDRPYDNSVRGV